MLSVFESSNSSASRNRFCSTRSSSVGVSFRYASLSRSFFGARNACFRTSSLYCRTHLIWRRTGIKELLVIRGGSGGARGSGAEESLGLARGQTTRATCCLDMWRNSPTFRTLAAICSFCALNYDLCVMTHAAMFVFFFFSERSAGDSFSI